MGWTRNCSHTISSEHFISENVLSILNPKSVRISGAAWMPPRQSLDLPLTGLQANILCTRHNSALSPLDTMAGKLFRAVDGIYDNLGRGGLSRRSIWQLFSGEELELWLLKTVLGFFHANVLSQNGRSKWTKRLTPFYPGVENLFHVRASRVTEDRAVTEGAWTPLHSPLKPAHRFAFAYGFRNTAAEPARVGIVS